MRLKHIASLKAGDAITSNSINEEDSYPVFGGNGIRGYTSAYTHDGPHVLIGRQGALCGNINYASGRFWASEHAVVVTILGDDDVVWLGELLRAMDLNQYSQSAAQPGISVNVIANLEVSVPPISTQLAIADFLDRGMSRIDALIEKKLRLLSALTEAQPVAASMVLLGTVDGPGPLRASWPASWGRIPFRWLFAEVDERSADGSEQLMSVSQTRGVIAQVELGDRRQFAETLVGYKICRKDDLVINRMWVYYGALGVAPGLGLVSPDYSVFRSRGQLRADLASYILRTPPYVGEMTRLVQGVGSAFQGAVRKPRLHPRELGQIVMPVPPIEEQEGLIAQLVRHRNQLGERVRLIEMSVALLQARRQALITAAVTGQLEIPAAA